MRFIPVKSEEAQAAAMVFWMRERLIWQRTQMINALSYSAPTEQIQGFELGSKLKCRAYRLYIAVGP